jgi:tRNA U38,U39,U40 pseudouridine synthase TruA
VETERQQKEDNDAAVAAANVHVKTVEGDLFAGLQRTCVAAGRTDKGVSAISQIISFR